MVVVGGGQDEHLSRSSRSRSSDQVLEFALRGMGLLDGIELALPCESQRRPEATRPSNGVSAISLARMASGSPSQLQSALEHGLLFAQHRHVVPGSAARSAQDPVPARQHNRIPSRR